jgi:hypothetical protein
MKLISECQIRQLEATHAASAVTFCGGLVVLVAMGLLGAHWL